MKRWLFALLFLLPLCGGGVYAAPENLPEELHLLFDDRTLTLDLDVQKNLIQRVPQHFLIWQGQRIPIDLGETLPEKTLLMDLETVFVFRVSPVALQQYLESISILRTDTQKTVEIQLDETGKVLFEGTPNDGYEINIEKLVHLLDRAIASGKKNVRVPAKRILSQVVVHPDLAARGIEEIIAIGESNFTGSSAARRQNIRVAAAQFDGEIIPEGGWFSFNKILGSVGEEKGFVRELVIKGNKTEKELGGGTCQVSTTAFRAAFRGGFPIPVRRNHSYAVPYYRPYGLDATIYLGAQDLRFINDSPGDILIQAFVEDDDLFFVFYGTNDGREVSFEGPFISNYQNAPPPIVYETEDLPAGEMIVFDQAHAGFRTEWFRWVKKGASLRRESFVSEYRPWPAKIQRGIGKKED